MVFRHIVNELLTANGGGHAVTIYTRLLEFAELHQLLVVRGRTCAEFVALSQDVVIIGVPLELSGLLGNGLLQGVDSILGGVDGSAVVCHDLVNLLFREAVAFKFCSFHRVSSFTLLTWLLTMKFSFTALRPKGSRYL